MSERPLVSVVIPTYDDAAYLPRAIKSVQSQTYNRIELVVVDDGSTNDVEKLVNENYSGEIKNIKHQENKGGSAARNTGIRHADGDYIAFLDADDEWKPEKIESQVDLLQSRSDDWIAAYCGVENKSGDGKKSKSIPNYSQIIYGLLPSFNYFETKKEGGSELISSVLCNRFFLGGASTILIRSQELSEIGGFDEDFERLQDMEFLIRILENGHLAYVENNLVINHYTGFSTTANETIKVKKKYLNKFSEKVIQLEMDGTCVTSIHRLDIARRFFLEGDLLTGLYYLKGSKLAKPQSVVGLLTALIIGIRLSVDSQNHDD